MVSFVLWRQQLLTQIVLDAAEVECMAAIIESYIF